jgi:subfamily B ATP-binding cassette protein HlyB/CyaB
LGQELVEEYEYLAGTGGGEDFARLVDPVTHADRFEPLDSLYAQIEPLAILVCRRMGGPGIDPRTFGFRWFLPSIWRYRKPLMHVLISSLFIQVFALVTPLFFQVIVDKVLAHKSNSTLLVMVAGIDSR